VPQVALVPEGLVLGLKMRRREREAGVSLEVGDFRLHLLLDCRLQFLPKEVRIGRVRVCLGCFGRGMVRVRVGRDTLAKE
jgi:hypothetical protein